MTWPTRSAGRARVSPSQSEHQSPWCLRGRHPGIGEESRAGGAGHAEAARLTMPERLERAAATRGFGHGYNPEVDEWRGSEWVDREEVEQRRELYGGPTYKQVLKERAEQSARIEQSIREEVRERPREPERSRDRDDGPSR